MGHKIFISSDMSVDARLIDVGERSSLAALLWPWLLTAFDDWGRSEASIKRLKAQVFPMLAEVTLAVIDEALQLYAETGLITLYDVDGRRYMAIPAEKWFSYQTHIRSEKRERDSSRYPAPPAGVASQDPASTSSARNHAQVRADARLAGARVSSPSPSPSLSPSLPVSGTGDSTGRENRARGHDADATLTPAADAAPPASSLSPSQQTTTQRTPSPRGGPPPAAQPDAREPPPNCDPALWTALLDGIGHAPATRAERAGWQNWLRQLSEARASPADVTERCGVYRRRYGPDIPLTPKALAQHWSELAATTSPAGGGGSSPYGLPPSPGSLTTAAVDARRAEDNRLAQEKLRLAREQLAEFAVPPRQSRQPSSAQAGPAAHHVRGQPVAG